MAANLPEPIHLVDGGLRIGTAPVNWNNNDLAGWRPVVPFPAILDEMRTAGYRETEWDESFGNDIDALNHERRTRGMSYTGAYRWLDFVNDEQFAGDLEGVRPFLETLEGIGARHLIVADSLRPERIAIAGAVPADGSASLPAPAYSRLAANLHRLAVAANEHGLAVHYHNHVGSYVESPFELDALVDVLHDTGVDLCFDTGHFAFGGGNACDFLMTHGDKIGYLHLKDVDARVLDAARARRWNFLDALRNYIFCPIGTGNARIADIIGHLVDVRFPHYVIIEQDTCRDDSTVNARANLEMVRRFEQAATSLRRTTS